MAPPSGNLTIEAMNALLDNKVKKVATSAQLDEMNTRISGNTEQIRILRGAIANIEKEVEKSSSEIQKKTLDAVHTLVEEKMEKNPLLGCQAGTTTRNGDKEAAYFHSRNSLRVWPIKGDNESEWKRNFEEFARGALEMDAAEVDNLDIIKITRTRIPPRSNIHLEILITFSSPEARDSISHRGGFLATYINENRKPLAGLRMDVPGFLTGVFKLLNSYGFHLKRVHGNQTKKYVKFDEANLSLYLDVRLPDAEEWIQISPTQARALKEQRDAVGLARLTRSLESGSGSSSTSSSTSEPTSIRGFPIRPNPNFIPLGQSDGAGTQGHGQVNGRWRPPPRDTI